VGQLEDDYMTRTLNIAHVSIAGFIALLASGCKVTQCPDAMAIDGGRQVPNQNCLQFESTIEYDGPARTASQRWSQGKNVTIENANGSLVVDGMLVSNVEVSGVPFTRDGTSAAERQHATDHLNAMAPPSVTLDASSNVVVTAPGGGFDGYKLTVYLPLIFDGVLSVNNGNGSISYAGTPTSVGNRIHAGNGDITATIGTSARATVTAATDLGKVVFNGGWVSPVLSMDQRSGNAQVGDGTGSLDVTTNNGDIELDIK
jgi:hypothetical protein